MEKAQKKNEKIVQPYVSTVKNKSLHNLDKNSTSIHDGNK
jgi:hypothetical protein